MPGIRWLTVASKNQKHLEVALELSERGIHSEHDNGNTQEPERKAPYRFSKPVTTRRITKKARRKAQSSSARQKAHHVTFQQPS